VGEARTASVIARPAHGEGTARRNPWPAHGPGVIPCHARRQRLGSRPSRRLERIAGREWGTAQPRALHRVGLGGDRGRGGRLRAHRSPARRRTAVVGETRTVLSTPRFLSRPEGPNRCPSLKAGSIIRGTESFSPRGRLDAVKPSKTSPKAQDDSLGSPSLRSIFMASSLLDVSPRGINSDGLR